MAHASVADSAVTPDRWPPKFVTEAGRSDGAAAAPSVTARTAPPAAPASTRTGRVAARSRRSALRIAPPIHRGPSRRHQADAVQPAARLRLQQSTLALRQGFTTPA